MTGRKRNDPYRNFKFLAAGAAVAALAAALASRGRNSQARRASNMRSNIDSGFMRRFNSILNSRVHQKDRKNTRR